MEIEFEVKTDGYVKWAEETISSFHRMLETMKNVAEIIRLQTAPLVPLDTSALEQSFDYQVMEMSSFILLGVGFDAVDEKSNFHYAYYQHETVGLRHKEGRIDHYLTVGIQNAKGEAFRLIERDYMSLFAKGTVGRGRTNIDERLNPRFVYLSLEDWIE